MDKPKNLEGMSVTQLLAEATTSHRARVHSQNGSTSSTTNDQNVIPLQPQKEQEGRRQLA